MGKPLSRPDCLRQNPSCVGKGEEEDLNIDDCYVPQRSIYDTVRLNEQIDSGSKGSLASRHFVGTLPYSHRTLDMSALCGNGVLASSSAFELRGRLDDRGLFDGLKFNGDVIRVSGTIQGKPRVQGDKKEPLQHRRSWRSFVPANLSEYGSCSGTLCTDQVDQQALVGRVGRGRSVNNSLTSEDDSGLCSPTADRERRKQHSQKRPGPSTRSLSSSEAVHVSGDLQPERSVSSGHEEFPFSPVRDCVRAPAVKYYLAVQENQQFAEPRIIDPSNSEHVVTGCDSPVVESRRVSGSTNRTQNFTQNGQPRMISGYNELPTVELVEDTSSQEEFELLSVVVTQPLETQPLEQHVTKDVESYEYEQRATEIKMADLEEFLLAVERETGVANGLKQTITYVGDEEIEDLLTSLAACSQMDLMGLPSSQVS
uniref:Uncharacterized protein n=1 Tax=Astyanax mexicanus TaxID=7994 RepID=A0A3B1KIU8_ASTMX